MRIFGKKEPFVIYNIDRMEKTYGYIVLKGWVVNRDKSRPLEISVCDSKGKKLRVYTERLIREDVNELFEEDRDAESGIHILIDQAAIEEAFVWLTFENGKETKKERIQVYAGNSLKRFLRKNTERQGEEPDYDQWVRDQEPNARTRKAQEQKQFLMEPLFSVVIPLYNTPLPFLKAVADSVLRQTYGKVELCLADGSSDDRAEHYIRTHYAREKRIRYCRLKKNRGISENTNSAIRLATGDFIVFADHDDVLAPNAMYEMAKAVNENPETEIIYTDEDKINRKGNTYFGPHFKPDFSPELLCCNNYICHLFAVRRDLREKAGFLDSSYDGAQDYDYVLRCCELAQHICHIPKILYHWRTHPDSTAGNPESKLYAFDAGKRALEAHYARVGIDAAVENTDMRGRYRTRFRIKGRPLVTILIPNKDHVEDLKRCLDSIRNKTTYSDYEILIVENNSTEPETEDFYRILEADGNRETHPEDAPGSDGRCVTDKDFRGRVRVIRYKGAFNYAAIHNFAVPYAHGEYVVLLNNDTEVLSEEWLEELLGLCQKKDVGAVGAKLYYPDGTIQHAGVILGLCGVASHLYVGLPGEKGGYAARLVSVQDLSAVTGACMMTKKSVWQAVNGMEESLTVAYNDIDYCLKLRSAGYRIVFTPYAELTHYESKTRGLEDTEEKRQRLCREADLFRSRWKDVLDAGDPYY
ncbi:MAG: glycosyltransferase family 2 protein, partial [Lachnospiraceae bacterium]|nr:glycosyltransferase family 2 protein [Lachnospiraceae bacterium]